MATMNPDKVSRVYPNGLPAASALDLGVADRRDGRARARLRGAELSTGGLLR
jgi:hypothetical protein